MYWPSTSSNSNTDVNWSNDTTLVFTGIGNKIELISPVNSCPTGRTFLLIFALSDPPVPLLEDIVNVGSLLKFIPPSVTLTSVIVPDLTVASKVALVSDPSTRIVTTLS